MKTQLLKVTREHWRKARESYRKNTKATMMSCPLEMALQEANFLTPSVSLYTFKYFDKFTFEQVGILSKGALILRRIFDQQARMPKLPQEVEINLCTRKEMKAFTKKYLGESVSINKYYE